MTRIAKILNWCVVIFFGVSTLILGVRQASTPLSSVLFLVPYGSALIAMRPDSRRFALWFAAAIHALLILILLASMVEVFGHPDQLALAALIVVICAVPSVINLIVLTRRLREKVTSQ